MVKVHVITSGIVEHDRQPNRTTDTAGMPKTGA